ncbi:MAG TPA: hypothetical protein VEK57_19275 [Thermoanaerobaculia bacterium]|nr:hypothetical protein [Thermoanaerobaculia bacterium]
MKLWLSFIVALLIAVAAPAFGALYPSGGPHSTDNDDSCDIALLPAATLLLPYYEVDFGAGGKTTLFTVMNVSNTERIAHVTVLTDRSFPLLTFDLRLAPYDTRSINLYDVIVGGRIESCDGPETLSAEMLARVRKAFTTGIVPVDSRLCGSISGAGLNAAGFVTIDLVASCTTLTLHDRAYFTDAIRFDNVLAGDYQHVDPRNGPAEGSSLVHIRAIPEGGDAGTRAVDPKYQVNFPGTFYGRYQDPAPPLDARQPLPTVFVAPWETDRRAGVATSWIIWRDVRSRDPHTCGYSEIDDGRLVFPEIVRFDDSENAIGEGVDAPPCSCLPTGPETSAAGRYADDHFLQFEDVDSGWLYFNLAEWLPSGEWRPSDPKGQAWVVASRTFGSASTMADAVALGNGCSRPAAESEISEGLATLGPAPNINP